MKSREERLVIIAIIAILLYAVFNYNSKTHESKKAIQIDNTNLKKNFRVKNKNLSEAIVVNYIVNVINNGSNHLGFQKEGMEGGYVPKDTAKSVACYVYELSGRKCRKAYSKDSSLYFSSNCAGCHGNDGKGVNGKFPNLTKKRLLGLADN